MTKIMLFICLSLGSSQTDGCGLEKVNQQFALKAGINIKHDSLTLPKKSHYFMIFLTNLNTSSLILKLRCCMWASYLSDTAHGHNRLAIDLIHSAESENWNDNYSSKIVLNSITWILPSCSSWFSDPFSYIICPDQWNILQDIWRIVSHRIHQC